MKSNFKTYYAYEDTIELNLATELEAEIEDISGPVSGLYSIYLYYLVLSFLITTHLMFFCKFEDCFVVK